MHPGVIIGVMAGVLFGGWSGGLIGGLIAYILLRNIQISLNYNKSKIDQKLLEVLFLALGKIAKSDGVVREEHIECARYEIDYLHLDDKRAKIAMLDFNRGKTATNFAEALAPFMGQRDVANWIISACWRMAWADGTVGLREKQTLVQLGQMLNISVAEVLAWGKEYQPDFAHKQNFSGGSYSEALQLLGVKAEDSFAHVKKTYRKLLSKNHPDKLAGSGASEQQIKQATETTRQLHNAYQLICTKNGWR